MKTIELTRTNGRPASVTIAYEAGDTFESPSVFSMKTAEVSIENASLITKSQVKLYADALKKCRAVIGGKVDREPGLIACIRLDELNYARLHKEMEALYSAVSSDSAAAVR